MNLVKMNCTNQATNRLVMEMKFLTPCLQTHFVMGMEFQILGLQFVTGMKFPIPRLQTHFVMGMKFPILCLQLRTGIKFF